MNKHNNSSKIFELQTKLNLKKQTIELKNQQKNAEIVKLRKLNQKLAEEFKPIQDKNVSDEGYVPELQLAGAFLDLEIARRLNQDDKIIYENSHELPSMDQGIEVVPVDQKIIDEELEELKNLEAKNNQEWQENHDFQEAQQNHDEKLANSKTYFEIIKTQKIIDELTTEMKQLNSEMTEIKQSLNEYFLKEKTHYLAQQKDFEIKPSVKVKPIYHDPMNEYYEQNQTNLTSNVIQPVEGETSLYHIEKQNHDDIFFHNSFQSLKLSQNQLELPTATTASPSTPAFEQSDSAAKLQQKTPNQQETEIKQRLAEIDAEKQKNADALKKIEAAEQKRQLEKRAKLNQRAAEAKRQAAEEEQKQQSKTKKDKAEIKNKRKDKTKSFRLEF